MVGAIVAYLDAASLGRKVTVECRQGPPVTGELRAIYLTNMPNPLAITTDEPYCALTLWAEDRYIVVQVDLGQRVSAA